MSIINRISAISDEVAGWRRDFHAHPELGYEVERTAGRVADLLRSFDIDEVVTGIGRTGVVGIIHGKSPGRMIGLRAELDALPMHEDTGLAHASTTTGKMHACGHDGHSAMLLGAAKYLAETRDFAGSVALIFQPAEEAGAGGRAMADDGLFERWPIEAVFAMHNFPGIPDGAFATRTGPIAASSDIFDIIITGRGGHAAWPHTGADPIVAAAQIISAVQSIVSRGADPLLSAVVSITRIEAGSAYNVIPDSVRLAGTMRALDPELGLRLGQRLREITESVAVAFGCTAHVDVQRFCGVVTNDERLTQITQRAAIEVAGADGLIEMTPIMGGDDFAWMLEKVPGSYIYIGNGNSAGLHTVKYDFSDGIIAAGMSYWARLVQAANGR